MSQDSVNTPCIGVCTVADNGLCMGCFRSMDEIGNWLNFSDDEKAGIMEQLAARMEAMFA